MNDTQGRALLYGGAIALLAGIGVWWANTSTDADVMTLLSSADVQLRMAYAIPPVDHDGKRLDTRDEMIACAIEQLETVERIEPGLAVTAEFRGFAHMLEDEFTDAAQCYERARACGDCAEEQHDILAFNEARMWAQAGSRERALAVFAKYGAALDERFGHQRILEEAAILRELGRRDEAFTRLDTVVRDRAAPPMATLQAGREYLLLGSDRQAEDALESIRKELPIADYHLAQLKLRQGEVDSSFELLTRASQARPAEVRRMLRDEANVWSAVANDDRFQELSSLPAASPGR